MKVYGLDGIFLQSTVHYRHVITMLVSYYIPVVAEDHSYISDCLNTPHNLLTQYNVLI